MWDLPRGLPITTIILFSLIPLTNELNNTNFKNLLSTVKQFSDDIGMEFGLDKCVKATFRKGKLTSTTPVELDIGTTIRDLDQDKT